MLSFRCIWSGHLDVCSTRNRITLQKTHFHFAHVGGRRKLAGHYSLRSEDAIAPQIDSGPFLKSFEFCYSKFKFETQGFA